VGSGSHADKPRVMVALRVCVKSDQTWWWWGDKLNMACAITAKNFASRRPHRGGPSQRDGPCRRSPRVVAGFWTCLYTRREADANLVRAFRWNGLFVGRDTTPMAQLPKPNTETPYALRWAA
jgi:hypothetical protein